MKTTTITTAATVVLAILCRWSTATSSFIPGSFSTPSSGRRRVLSFLAAESSPKSRDRGRLSPESLKTAKNIKVVNGLLEELTAIVDKWIVNGSPVALERAHELKQRIVNDSSSSSGVPPELTNRAARIMSRAGMPESRPQEARQRQEWEKGRSNDDTDKEGVSEAFLQRGRSALSERLPDHLNREASASQKYQSFVEQQQNSNPMAMARDKEALQADMAQPLDHNTDDTDTLPAQVAQAASLSIARAGAAFTGTALGIGGLDDALATVRRRVWVPLAAPPSLLRELGVAPVRGLLLYGPPGCGKTLLARRLGDLLSPDRPVTLVSGPEIMDKFVGSSEKNLRELFDNPPPLRSVTKDERYNRLMERAALHVIVLDEFDALARARGAGGDSQGDAGVARDSVVNQLLAKMDGVGELGTPTLIIGLTNRRELIEPALLRPGRFEVQVYVPPPSTVLQREAILDVHLRRMVEAGRVLLSDAVEGGAAFKRLESSSSTNDCMTYDQLRNYLAVQCEGMTGASLAGVCRAAASRALERAVTDFGEGQGMAVDDCVVTVEDFEQAMDDVRINTQDDVEEKPKADKKEDADIEKVSVNGVK